MQLERHGVRMCVRARARARTCLMILKCFIEMSCTILNVVNVFMYQTEQHH